MNNGANYMAPLPVGHQQDLNYLYSQIQELSSLLQSNREKVNDITRSAEEVAVSLEPGILKENEISNHHLLQRRANGVNGSSTQEDPDHPESEGKCAGTHIHTCTQKCLSINSPPASRI